MKIREIDAVDITETVRRLCMEANTVIGDDMLSAFKKGMEMEKSPVGKGIFQQLLQNADIAKSEKMPLCQDTGLVIVFAELGQDVHIQGEILQTAINEGVRQGYEDGYFRKSSRDLITGKNPGDNTPAILHVEMVPGDALKLTVAPKGFGAENMSRVRLFPPATGIEGVKEYIVQCIEEAGANPCPPIIVGVGLGGTMEKAALLAKKALFRPIGVKHENPEIAQIEADLLERINRTGIGPQGLGGTITALSVHVETYPTHIASIPVAVNLQCHANRHKEAVL